MWINEIQFQSLRSFCILYKITIHTCNCDISIVNYCYSIKKSFNIFKPSLKKIVWFVTFLWRETLSFTMKQPHTDQGKVTPSFFLSCFLSYKPQPESLPLPMTAFPQFSKFAHLYQLVSFLFYPPSYWYHVGSFFFSNGKRRSHCLI